MTFTACESGLKLFFFKQPWFENVMLLIANIKEGIKEGGMVKAVHRLDYYSFRLLNINSGIEKVS